MPDTIPNLHQWERGPKITAIGGGTGLSTMLRGLKKYTKNLTAVVTVADDGGGSGMLRRDIGMPPPGDIRRLAYRAQSLRTDRLAAGPERHAAGAQRRK